MINSTFTGLLNMSSLQLKGSLLMGNTAKSAAVVFLYLRGDRPPRRERAEFTDVGLNNAKIDGDLIMRGSKFTGLLSMDGLKVGGSLQMRDKAEFAGVDLPGAKIDGQLTMTSSKFTGPLNMDSLQVGTHIFMRRVEVTTQDEIDLVSSDIGGNLQIGNGSFPSLNLTGTKIHGEFSLGSKVNPSLKWQPYSRLVLRNTEVGVLQDSRDVWPKNLELDGFLYDRLGGIDAESVDDPADREAVWYIDWLAKQGRYSPQPYEHLASVLRKAGHSGKAKEILYAGRNRELENTAGWLDYAWLFLLKVIIGYGYRIYYALIWFLGFSFFGAMVLRATGEALVHKIPWGVFYSVDMLLPIVKLRELHYKIDLHGYARYYFYFHKLMGYVLVSFLIAGLSGLTK
jgi:hypothetical protein